MNERIDDAIERSKKYVDFIKIPGGHKTKIWKVFSDTSGDIIGIIRWHSPWRHYCFFPNAETVYSDGCLLNIGNFILEANEKYARRNK